MPSKVKVSARRGLLSTGFDTGTRCRVNRLRTGAPVNAWSTGPGHIYTHPPTRPGSHLSLGTSPSGAPVSTGLSPVWLPSTGPIVSTSLSTGPLLAGRVNRASRACHRSTGPRRDTVDRTKDEWRSTGLSPDRGCRQPALSLSSPRGGSPSTGPRQDRLSLTGLNTVSLSTGSRADTRAPDRLWSTGLSRPPLPSVHRSVSLFVRASVNRSSPV